MSVAMGVLLLCLSACACGGAWAQGVAQTVEQAVQDVDAAYQVVPESAPARKLFHPGTARTNVKKTGKKKSRDFVVAHQGEGKKAHPAIAKTPRPAIQTEDLMNGMRQNLDAQVLVPVPAQDAAAATPTLQDATVSALKVPSGQHIIKPIPSGKLFHPGTKPSGNAPTGDGNDVLTNMLPVVTPAPSGAEPPAVPAQAAVSAQAVVKDSKNEAPTKEAINKDAVVKGDSRKDPVKTGAPLLTDLHEAPAGAQQVRAEVIMPEPNSDRKAEGAVVAPARVDAPPSDVSKPGFSKPRRLFSSVSDNRKRPGITRVVRAGTFFNDPADVPPVAIPEPDRVHERIIQPVAAPQDAHTDEKQSIWGQPMPEMTRGKVLYTQAADGMTGSAEEPARETNNDGKQVDRINNVVKASCGTANGSNVPAAPKDNLCAQGIATTVMGNGPFTWSCQSADGDKVAPCMATLQVNAVCGSADGVAVNAAPTRDLCRAGHASDVTGEDTFVWTCAGSGGGVNDTCQASLIKNKAVNMADAKALSPVTLPHALSGKTGNECTPAVKRWTITCQQGGYPSSYTGMIVGETQTQCPTNVERGVWLSNSCSASVEFAPVSKSPGKLAPPAPVQSAGKAVTEVLPEIMPMPVGKLEAPRKLFTPRYKKGSASVAALPVSEDMTTLVFAPGSEAMDAQTVNALEGTVNALRGEEKSIVTLNAYAAAPAGSDTQESRRLALARALAVRSYLMREGVSSDRIDVRAIGSSGNSHGDDRVDITIK